MKKIKTLMVITVNFPSETESVFQFENIKLHELKGYLSNFTFKFCRVLDI